MSQENETNTEELLEDELDESQDEQDNSEEQIDWKERALKAERAIIKSKNKPKSNTPKETVDTSIIDELNVLKLNVEGIKDADEIKLVIEKSKLLGISPVEALKDELILGLLARGRKEKLDNLATPGTSNRGKTLTESMDKVKARIMNGTASAEDYAKVRKAK